MLTWMEPLTAAERLGRAIARRRGQLGLSQDELAALVKTAKNTVSRHELGDRCPSAVMLANYATALHTSADVLLGRVRDPDELTATVRVRPIYMVDRKAVRSILQAKRWSQVKKSAWWSGPKVGIVVDEDLVEVPEAEWLEIEAQIDDHIARLGPPPPGWPG